MTKQFIGSILFFLSMSLLTHGLYAQLNLGDLKKMKEAKVASPPQAPKESKEPEPEDELRNQVLDIAKENKNVKSLEGKAEDMKDQVGKNEKNKDFFTGGEKLSVSKTVMELKNDPAPQSKKILLIAGGLDEQYLVFQGNKEFALYRFKNLPPGANSTQFVLKKMLEKEIKQVYKKGSPLESGYYEIIGKKSFREFTFDETPVIIIQRVDLKLL
jgi:hypothetical protein